MTPSRFKALFAGLTSIAQKVYYVVPIADAWTVAQIHAELARTGANVDRKIVSGCLATLVESRLITGLRDKYQRMEVREPSPELRPIGIGALPRPPEPPPAAPVPVTLVARVNAIAEGLRTLADEIAIVGLEIEDELASSSADAQKLKQLHQLLKSLS